ncbi:MAG: Sigma-24 [Bacteroidota bacterium]|jgi:RNA polymerase sigma-70 factor (ECF subfamily)
MQEDDLLIRLKAADRAAFTELVNQYSNQVFNTCYKFLLNKEEAEDLTQEIFIEVYQSLKKFRGDSKLSTWIYRIAVTKCLDEIKKRNRKKRISSLGKILHLDEIVHWLVGETSPDKDLQQKEKWKAIEQALNQLPDNQRVAFTLSKIEGYSNPEIAELMNTSTVAIESLIYRAKKNVGAELEIILKNN